MDRSRSLEKVAMQNQNTHTTHTHRGAKEAHTHSTAALVWEERKHTENWTNRAPSTEPAAVRAANFARLTGWVRDSSSGSSGDSSSSVRPSSSGWVFRMRLFVSASVCVFERSRCCCFRFAAVVVVVPSGALVVPRRIRAVSMRQYRCACAYISRCISERCDGVSCFCVSRSNPPMSGNRKETGRKIEKNLCNLTLALG